MSVSVILPTYNRAAVVGEAIGSVLGQTHEDFELIVVDDGSEDDTARRVRGFADRRIRYVRQANAGVAMARNLGVHLSRRPLVSFLDSDDLWAPRKLERDVACLRARPDVDGVFSDAEKRHGAAVLASWMRATPTFSRHLPRVRTGATLVPSPRALYLCLLEEDPIVTDAVTLRREAFVRLGGFDPAWRVFEDWEFYLRFARAATLAYLDEPLTIVRISHDSIHLVRAEEGRRRMLAHLAALRRDTADREASAAARRGMIRLRLRLHWDFLDSREYRRSILACLHGFRETGDPGLLLRAAVGPIGRHPRRWLRRGVEYAGRTLRRASSPFGAARSLEAGDA
jgi:hypothetical protein